MRHAKSSWSDPSLSDYDRPLNNRGKRAAATMGKLMNDLEISPGMIFCSSSRRARDTLKYLQESNFIDCPIEYLEELYHADISIYTDIITSLPGSIDSAMLIGHNPDIEFFLEIICDSHESMPTAALAEISFDSDNWLDISNDINVHLENLWRPKDLN